MTRIAEAEPDVQEGRRRIRNYMRALIDGGDLVAAAAELRPFLYPLPASGRPFLGELAEGCIGINLGRVDGQTTLRITPMSPPRPRTSRRSPSQSENFSFRARVKSRAISGCRKCQRRMYP